MRCSWGGGGGRCRPSSLDAYVLISVKCCRFELRARGICHCRLHRHHHHHHSGDNTKRWQQQQQQADSSSSSRGATATCLQLLLLLLLLPSSCRRCWLQASARLSSTGLASLCLSLTPLCPAQRNRWWHVLPAPMRSFLFAVLRLQIAVYNHRHKHTCTHSHAYILIYTHTLSTIHTLAMTGQLSEALYNL